ncbi:unnamed protein product [Spirodela intermedia]|uniref:WRKY domain-containing protein n=1 Tax=Spirodela intermedia TaxID=51605 RepID=A0A7I8IWR0_SPIIN|nr:unnamed protein product [Spirodela intermedia]CAA6662211.1 unnamed protein product [Spirodela intermedia]
MDNPPGTRPEQTGGVGEMFEFVGEDHFGNSSSSSIGGFMELLGLSPSLFELPISPPPPLSESLDTLLSSSPEFSDKMDPPPTPSDADQPKSAVTTEADEEEEEEEEDDEEEEKETKKSRGTKKRKNAKNGRQEPRFAFMTKSDVDNLDDGYRWRKYGQKAVKNGPFPRSYYRCTTALCGVKKRVERSAEDPSVVVTTYEGQHTHPTPIGPRCGGGAAHHFCPLSLVGAPPLTPLAGVSAFSYPLQRSQPPFSNNLTPPSLALSPVGGLTDRSSVFVRDRGLLQDLVSLDSVKRE